MFTLATRSNRSLVFRAAKIARFKRRTEEYRRNEAIFADLKIHQERLLSDLRQAIESGDGFVSDPAVFQRWKSAYERTADSLDGDVAGIFRAAIQKPYDLLVPEPLSGHGRPWSGSRAACGPPG